MSNTTTAVLIATELLTFGLALAKRLGMDEQELKNAIEAQLDRELDSDRAWKEFEALID